MCNFCKDKYDPKLKRYFPPPLHLLLSWTTIFRSAGTLSNYLGYVKTGCLVFNKPVQVSNGIRLRNTLCARLVYEVFDEPALRKAKQSVDKAGNFARRERMFVHWAMLEAMLDISVERPEVRNYALLFLLSYTFLLRTPSEALPAMAGVDALGLVSESNSILFVD